MLGFSLSQFSFLLYINCLIEYQIEKCEQYENWHYMYVINDFGATLLHG